MQNITEQPDITSLLNIMQQLRDPDKGCPWDIAQNFKSIVPYTIEETYEVADAIEREAWDEVKDELGDLLFQIVFYAQLAKEQQLFEFNDVVEAICDKLERRHPHVFGDADSIDSVEEQTRNWEAIKKQEKATQRNTHGILDDIIPNLPGLAHSLKLQKRAAKAGFDWPDIQGVIAKLDEEVTEFKQANSKAEQLDELGDVLFTCVNLIRHLDDDPEAVMRKTNKKFINRFEKMEALLQQQGKSFAGKLSIEEMENAWQAAKKAE